MSSGKVEVNAGVDQADNRADSQADKHANNHANNHADEQAVLTRHVASTRFEAAREIGGLSADNKFSRVHGHGFLVSVHADGNLLGSNSVAPAAAAPATAWPAYRGGEIPAMLGELQHLARQLDYQRLNDIVPNPTDVQVAKWFGRQLSVPHLSAIALQSTPEQGVLVGMGVGVSADSDAGADGQPSTRLLVWRRYRFQAAHQLPNVAPGHKCGRMHGHGFEVVLYAVSGDGLVDDAVNYSTLDAAWAQMAGQLSFQCLNDIPGLENPTSELLSSWIWQRLKSVVPTLSAVTVYETASCGATFDGEHYRIWKDFSVDSAVRYRHAADVEDPRARLHGYTYTLRLNLCAPLDDVMGWTVDFGDVKEIFNPVFKALDHHPLHENPELSAVSDGDTASMARWLFHKTQRMLPSMVRVDLFETEGCGASVGTDLEGPSLPLVRL